MLVLQRMSLYLAALCHDVDHRGFNNAFLANTSHPLASLYPNSIMESHHTSQMIALLQLSNLNVFALLTAEEYKMVYLCILSSQLKHSTFIWG